MFDGEGEMSGESDDDDIGDKTAVTDNDSLQIDENEKVTGKFESSNFDTETSIETGDAKYISNIQTSAETLPKLAISRVICSSKSSSFIFLSISSTNSCVAFSNQKSTGIIGLNLFITSHEGFLFALLDVKLKQYL